MIVGIEHVVLTVADLERTIAFYAGLLGMECRRETGRPTALTFGSQKINLHQKDHTFEPKALCPTPGSADFCLVTHKPLAEWLARLQRSGIALELGPVERTGARGPMNSIYFRDPDNNLVKVSKYD